ncbi:MAG: DUF1294 domain-containing protein [Clostridia bacterium]
MNFTEIILIYIALISIVAIFITIKDKRAAIRGAWRVKESTLLIISALFGSLAMYITMLSIRHKTMDKKFMIGIPVIMVLQIALALSVSYIIQY